MDIAAASIADDAVAAAVVVVVVVVVDDEHPPIQLIWAKPISESSLQCICAYIDVYICVVVVFGGRMGVWFGVCFSSK